MAKRFIALRKKVPEETRISQALFRHDPSENRRCLFNWTSRAAVVFFFSLAGCAHPYPQYTHLISIRWGAIIPVPQGTTVVRQKDAVYLLSNRRNWSLTLSVRRPSHEERIRLPLREEKLRRMLKESKNMLERREGKRWIEGSLSWLVGARGLRFDFEGPPEKGQASIYFRRGEILYHRVAFLSANKRLYRLHLQSLRLAKDEALEVWSDLAGGIRLSGKPIVSFLNSEDVPESDHLSMIRRTLRSADKKRDGAQ